MLMIRLGFPRVIRTQNASNGLYPDRAHFIPDVLSIVHRDEVMDQWD
jgi:hypothetical protein